MGANAYGRRGCLVFWIGSDACVSRCEALIAVLHGNGGSDAPGEWLCRLCALRAGAVAMLLVSGGHRALLNFLRSGTGCPMSGSIP